MSNATDQARSTRSDARAFADAFAAADDAFTFGPDAGESRELTLAELGDVLALDGPVALPAEPSVAAARRIELVADDDARDDDLLTLDELGDVLARPVRDTDDLDFDFGTSAHERARRRTAARFAASPAARRRVSGSASPRRTAADEHTGERFRRPGDTSAAGRSAMADAAASAAELLAVPNRSRFAREADATGRFDAAAPVGRAADAGSDSRRAGVVGRTNAGAPARLREVQRDRAPHVAAVDRIRANPDRVAMWAVLLGILLVLIAFTSGSAGAIALPVLAL